MRAELVRIGAPVDVSPREIKRREWGERVVYAIIEKNLINMKHTLNYGTHKYRESRS